MDESGDGGEIGEQMVGNLGNWWWLVVVEVEKMVVMVLMKVEEVEVVIMVDMVVLVAGRGLLEMGVEPSAMG